MKSVKTISFIIPCYYSEKTLAGVVAEIDTMMEKLPGYDHEILMINDGSKDGTWQEILRLCGEKEQRRGINFARNFGQHAALMAGLRSAEGELILCLDDDGQTPASEAPKLIRAIEAGADVVYASYGRGKKHSFFRNFGTLMNEEMAHLLLGKPRELFVSSYFVMRRFVAEEMIRYENSYPYLIGLVLRTTDNIVNVEVEHRSREQGSSGYTMKKLLGLWMNGFTAFSIQPLRFSTLIGAVTAGLGFLYGIYTIIKRLVNPEVPMGFSAIMSAIVFFGGMILLMLGMAGEYIGRTYISVNKAPQYVIRETSEEKTDEPWH